eukprot:g62654.t1
MSSSDTGRALDEYNSVEPQRTGAWREVYDLASIRRGRKAERARSVDSDDEDEESERVRGRGLKREADSEPVRRGSTAGVKKLRLAYVSSVVLDVVFELVRCGVVLVDVVFEPVRCGVVLVDVVFEPVRCGVVLVDVVFEPVVGRSSSTSSSRTAAVGWSSSTSSSSPSVVVRSSSTSSSSPSAVGWSSSTSSSSPSVVVRSSSTSFSSPPDVGFSTASSSGWSSSRQSPVSVKTEADMPRRKREVDANCRICHEVIQDVLGQEVRSPQLRLAEVVCYCAPFHRKCLVTWWNLCRQKVELPNCPHCRKVPSNSFRTSHFYGHEIVRWKPLSRKAIAQKSSPIDITADESEFSQFQPLPARVKPEPGSESAAPAESSAAVIAHQDGEYEVTGAESSAAVIAHQDGEKGAQGKLPEPVLDEEKQLRWAVEESIRAAQQLVTARSGQKREDVTEVGVSTQAGVQRESREARAAKFAKCYRLLSVRKPGQESQNVASAEAARNVGGQNYVTSVEALPISNGGAENNNVTSVEALPVSNGGAQDSRNVASAEVVGNGGAQVNSNEVSADAGHIIGGQVFSSLGPNPC